MNSPQAAEMDVAKQSTFLRKLDISSTTEHISLRLPYFHKAQTLLSPISSVIKAIDITNITDMPNPINMTGA